MGLAYARSLVGKNIVESSELTIYESFPERLLFLKDLDIAVVKPEIDDEISELDVLILATKPQQFSDLAKLLQPLLTANTIIISIMAGVKSSVIKEKLKVVKIVRAMPNTPCQNGHGATGYYLFPEVTKDEKEVTFKLLSSTGFCTEVKTEEDIDSVTAVSGSGPAYVYLFAKAMQEAGVSMGLEEKNTTKLVLQTLKGALNLMETSGETFDELIANVKSKGGTTEAALNNFIGSNFEQIVAESMQKAKDRASELSDMIK